MRLTLDVNIATFGIDGIMRVANMNLPRVENVHYVVSWQMPGHKEKLEIPDPLKRDDLSVFQIDSIGSSPNRNNAIECSTADICLVADDDLIYTPDQLNEVINVFQNDSTLELATFMSSGANNKWYPSESFDLSQKQKGYSVACFEIAFRRSALDYSLRFNNNFGVSAPVLQAGEDSVFLLEAIRKGVKGRFFPIVITHHSGTTTGFRPITNNKVLMAEGAYIQLAYGLQGILRLPLFAWRGWRKGRMRLLPATYHLFRGYIYAAKHL